ncbi:MAG: hypothetical protein KU29_07210 [Sulfurovum sp. FS06-10]|nr:MAG: hypothetical protein KU29_07210 [Sulfurovum sp. FS06-10]
MFNLILVLAIGIVIGWNFKTFFLALNPPQILNKEVNLTFKETADTVCETPESNIPIKPSEKSVIEINTTSKSFVATPKDTPTNDTFYTLLYQNLFSDAMALYLEANTQQLPLYQATLKDFFDEKSQINPTQTIQQMLEYIDIEPDNQTTKLQLIELFKTTQNFQELIDFLKERIENASNPAFYIFTLAEYYVNMQEYTKAKALLKEIEFDEIYGEKAHQLLLQLKNNEKSAKEFAHKIPLEKSDDHFVVHVQINNTKATLLLDTGASYTLIDEEKITSLTPIKENINLSTAGGDIIAQLQEAETFSMGSIELYNFQITTTSFQSDKADGLLGMNFFKHFKFKIDQEAGILYLSEQNDTNGTEG